MSRCITSSTPAPSRWAKAIYTAENLGDERALQSLERVLGRVETIRMPVEGAEIFEVIRRRLFEDLGDPAQHRAAVEAYWTMYQKLGEDVPAACREPGYRDLLLTAYPFHPELITALYERWGSIPEFQRTRGVLRLLAFVVSELYQAKDNEPLIQSANVNLGATEIRGELIKFTGNQFHAVVESDIAGKQSKAPEIDRQLGSEYAKESVSEKLARAIFLYSFGGSHQKGATLPQLRLAVLNPEMAPPFIPDALGRMAKKLWYLYAESGVYSFEARPNLNRILVDREELIRSEPDKVKEFVRATLNDLIGEAAFRVYRYPESDRDVADEARPSLVLLDLHQTATEDGPSEEAGEFVVRLLKQHGKSFRKHANVLVFLAPDARKVSEAFEAAVRLLARRHVNDDKATKRQLSDKQLQELAQRLKEGEAQMPAAVSHTWRHVLVPAANKTVRWFDLGMAAFDTRVKISQRVLELLKNSDQLLDKLDPAQLTGPRWGLWPADQPQVNVRALADYFGQLTQLPMLTGPGVLSESIARGVERGLFAYALGDAEGKTFDTIRFRQPVEAARCEITESAWLLRPEAVKALLPEPPAAPVSGGEQGPITDAGRDEAGAEAIPPGPAPGKVKIVQGERRLDRVRIVLHVKWEDWNEIYNDVIDPLARDGAEIFCDVNILAQGDGVIKENTVELVIREALAQRGIAAEIHKA
jgi:hypothetical protein